MYIVTNIGPFSGPGSGYEYVAGTNMPLKEAIDAMIAADEQIDREVTADLFRHKVVIRRLWFKKGCLDFA